MADVIMTDSKQWDLMIKEMERVQQAVRHLYIQLRPFGGPSPDFYDVAIKERMEEMRKNEGG